MRIAIVEDRDLAVELLRRVLVYIADYELAWVARNGVEAVEKCSVDTPDLVLMDLMMPVMNGVEATRRIMSQNPCAILVVTASVEQHSSEVFEAMSSGALDAVDTPALGPEGELDGDELLRKIATIGTLIGKSERRGATIVREYDEPEERISTSLIVIGASTGGPLALATVLSDLEDYSGSIVIVQHVDLEFADGLAGWLDQQTTLNVQVAAEDCRPAPGLVWLAATNDHLIVTRDCTLSHTPEPRATPYRPSIDVFFESVAENWPIASAAALLTGMGRDGARGLLSLRKAGWYTIAQDESTSAIYGMPKVAAEIDAAIEIAPLADIAPSLLRHLDGAARRSRGKRR